MNRFMKYCPYGAKGWVFCVATDILPPWGKLRPKVSLPSGYPHIAPVKIIHHKNGVNHFGSPRFLLAAERVTVV